MSEATAADLIKNRAIWPDDFREAIPRIREVADFDLAVPADLTERLAANAGDLLVPEEFLTECAAALMAGHLVLQGPPGTGKSSLARALARSFNAGLLPVTVCRSDP
ncbi:MAG: AAA family ATPase [Actinobacteria bacterium]|nr:AAA family ATPase [Actinomycetota bacterium]